eukprot:gene45041-38713_t
MTRAPEEVALTSGGGATGRRRHPKGHGAAVSRSATGAEFHQLAAHLDRVPTVRLARTASVDGAAPPTLTSAHARRRGTRG